MNTFLWVVFPYLAIGAFIAGLIWRYRYDKFCLLYTSDAADE